MNRDTWEHLQLARGKPRASTYSTVLHWPWLQPLRVDSSIKQCVFLCFWYIVIVHSQLINTMHHFPPGHEYNCIALLALLSLPQQLLSPLTIISCCISWRKARPLNHFPATNRFPCHHPPLRYLQEAQVPHLPCVSIAHPQCLEGP